MTRTGAGAIVGEEVRVRKFTGFGVDLKDSDVVGAQVADEEETVVGGNGDTVGVRGVLAGGDGAEYGEFLVVLEVDAVDGLAKGAIGLDAVGGYGAAKVVGHEGGVVGVVDRDVGRACSGGGDLAGLVEGAGFGVYRKGGGGGSGVVDGVDSVEEAFGGACGSYGEVGGSGGSYG